jgi:cold shock CspA family protein
MSNINDDDTTSSGNFNPNTMHTGRVKWFNNKAGYGFLTVCKSTDSEQIGQDIFAHHSGIKVDSEQYKYLVQGEYVDFTLRKSDSGSHPYQAANLTGISEGKLMCETRWDARQARGDEGDDAGYSRRDEGRQRGHDNGRRNRDRGGRNEDRRNYDGQREGRQRVRLRGSGPRDEENWKMTNESNKPTGREENQ